MKAVKITTENQSYLIGRFSNGEIDVEDIFPIGYWLIAPFGEEADYPEFSTVTQTQFENWFDVGEKLENGFVAVTLK